MELDYQSICRKALGTLRRRGVTAYIEAEELTSVGYVALAEAKPATEALGVTIARRAMIDAARKHEVRERGRYTPSESQNPQRSEWMNPEDEYGNDPLELMMSTGGGALRPENTHVDLWEAMKALPAREYQIVTLHFWGGKSQAAIADELGINQATVSRSLDSARKILASCINTEPHTITKVRGNEAHRAVLSGRKDAA